jgi:hypothetical protein
MSVFRRSLPFLRLSCRERGYSARKITPIHGGIRTDAAFAMATRLSINCANISCGRIFVPGRQRKYCCDKCQWAAGQRRWREQNPEKYRAFIERRQRRDKEERRASRVSIQCARPECGKNFVPTKNGTKCCSRKCARVVGSRNYRLRRGLPAGIRVIKTAEQKLERRRKYARTYYRNYRRTERGKNILDESTYRWRRKNIERQRAINRRYMRKSLLLEIEVISMSIVKGEKNGR